MKPPETFWLCCVPRPEREHLQDSPFSKAHAVRCSPEETDAQIGRRPARCGVRPARGWYIDGFINLEPHDATDKRPGEKCRRCHSIEFALQPNRHGWDAYGHCNRCGLAGEPLKEATARHECPPGFTSEAK